MVQGLRLIVDAGDRHRLLACSQGADLQSCPRVEVQGLGVGN